MYARGSPDITWTELAWSLFAHGGRSDVSLIDLPLSPHGSNKPSLITLSVRSGFDLLLQELNWPQGTEVLVSAINVPEMFELLECHGLVPVPIDVDFDTLEIDLVQAKASISERTKGMMVAHLFGSRMTMEPIAELARSHNLLLFEDCAQTFDGSHYQGHDQTDVAMFSFGPIKTCTCLGGGVFVVRDKELRDRMNETQSKYSIQSAKSYAVRTLRYGLFKILATTLGMRLLYWILKCLGINHDDWIFSATRGFSGGDFPGKFRKQPCRALVASLWRRIGSMQPDRLKRRVVHANRMMGLLGKQFFPGSCARLTTNWVVPFRKEIDPSDLRTLWQGGFDVSQRGSSMVRLMGVRSPSAFEHPIDLKDLMYLPPIPTKDADRIRLAELIQSI